jgi:hypothetical protein
MRIGHAGQARLSCGRARWCTGDFPFRMRPEVQVLPGPLKWPLTSGNAGCLSSKSRQARLHSIRDEVEYRSSPAWHHRSDQLVCLFGPGHPGGLGRTAVKERVPAKIAWRDRLRGRAVDQWMTREATGGVRGRVAPEQADMPAALVRNQPTDTPGSGSPAVRLSDPPETSRDAAGGLVGPAREELLPFLLGEAAAGDGAGPLEPGGGGNVP